MFVWLPSIITTSYSSCVWRITNDQFAVNSSVCPLVFLLSLVIYQICLLWSNIEWTPNFRHHTVNSEESGTKLPLSFHLLDSEKLEHKCCTLIPPYFQCETCRTWNCTCCIHLIFTKNNCSFLSIHSVSCCIFIFRWATSRLFNAILIAYTNRS